MPPLYGLGRACATPQRGRFGLDRPPVAATLAAAIEEARVRTIVMLLPMLVLAACGGAPPANEAASPSADATPAEIEMVPPSETALPTDAWIGEWVGVEGLVLDIAPSSAAGRYTLTVTLLDGTSKYDGTAEGDVIRFERDGKAETIRAATGAETGLKYLAAKQDCLVIKPGEGFCRD